VGLREPHVGVGRKAAVVQSKVMDMAKQAHYDMTAKAFHWTIVVLIVIQYPLGWLMPDIHRGMTAVVR
jgi:hypothetical protein